MVGISLPSLFVSGVNMSFARILKLVRMVRVMRLFRLVTAFTELRQFMVSMSGSAAMLFWVAVMYLCCTYCFAIFLMQSAAIFIEEAVASDKTTTAQEIRDNFGTLQDTMATLFHIVSGGDWFEA